MADALHLPLPITDTADLARKNSWTVQIRSNSRIRREGYRIGRAGMAFERLPLGSRSCIPQLDRAVVRRRRQQPAVRREGYCPDPAGMTFERLK
jgi:hypothetical protein